MLHESAHVRVSTDDGVATLWLSPPGGRIGQAVLLQLLPAVEAVATCPGVEILVLRSGTPVGFGHGLDPESLEEDLAILGQRVTAAIADLPVVTVAYLEGPVIGPGLELALACDYRLAVAGPDSWVSFGELPPGWGGQTRTGKRLAKRLTAREAVKTGLFDHAFCERRGKIELRTWLDRLQFNPRKRSPCWRSWLVNAEAGFAAERRVFRVALRNGVRLPDAPSPSRPLRAIGLIGTNPGIQHLAAELTMRGVSVVWVDAPPLPTLFREPLRRGRLTPLEAEQAAGRIREADDADSLSACDWVILSDQHTDLAAILERELLPRAIMCVPPPHLERVTMLASRPQRVVGLQLHGGSATLTDSDPDAVATVAGWLGLIGVNTTTVAPVRAPALV